MNRQGLPSVSGRCFAHEVPTAGEGPCVFSSPVTNFRPMCYWRIRYFAFLQPPSVVLQPPSVTLQPPWVILQPPSVVLQPPSVVLQPPWVILQPPSVILQPPWVILQPPSVVLQPAGRLSSNRRRLSSNRRRLSSKPPSVVLQPPSVILQPPWVILQRSCIRRTQQPLFLLLQGAPSPSPSPWRCARLLRRVDIRETSFLFRRRTPSGLSLSVRPRGLCATPGGPRGRSLAPAVTGQSATHSRDPPAVPLPTACEHGPNFGGCVATAVWPPPSAVRRMPMLWLAAACGV